MTKLIWPFHSSAIRQTGLPALLALFACADPDESEATAAGDTEGLFGEGVAGDDSCTPGTLNCECNDGLCFDELTCVDNLCVDGSEGGTGDFGGGGASEGGASTAGADEGGTNGSGDGGSGFGDSGDGGSGVGDSGDDSVPYGFAQGVELTGIEVAQGTSVAIARNGAPIDANSRSSILVAGRSALVRAIYTVSGSPGLVEGRLTLERPGEEPEVLVESKTLNQDSNLSSLGGTLEWRLSSEQVAPGTKYSLGLYDPSSSPGGSSTNPAPRIPAMGSADLGVPDHPMRLEVMLVGVSISIGSSHRQIVEDALYEMYPLSEIKVDVHPQGLPAQASVNNCLDALTSLRAADNPQPWVYYMGVGSAPGGGLSYSVGPGMDEAQLRVSCTELFDDWDFTARKFVAHELGHAHGRDHPEGCGVFNFFDLNFPYGEADGPRLGVQGYGVLEDRLYNPSDYFDFMGYCAPVWGSDYTFNALGERVRIVSGWGRQEIDAYNNSPTQDILRGAFFPDGTVRWSVSNGRLPKSLRRSDARLSGVMPGGERFGAEVFEVDIADSDMTWVLAGLPEATEKLRAITVTVDGVDHELRDLERLRDRFDR